MTTAPPFRAPLAYLLSFHPYGTWLPGDDRGWHRRGDDRRRPRAPGLAALCRERLRYPVVTFTPSQREVVRWAVAETCTHRGWTLHVLVVESDHVHAVLSAPVPPERALQDLKSWATRHLRARGYFPGEQRVWAEHGSTEYLFEARNVAGAIAYVLDDHHHDAHRSP